VWLPVEAPLLAFSANLLADLLLYLLEGLEEELFDVTALVEDHLAEGLDLAELRVLRAHYLSQVDYLLFLVSNYLFVLVSHELLFFLKVLHYLPEGLLENLDLALE
jgi:hypothetical protein